MLKWYYFIAILLALQSCGSTSQKFESELLGVNSKIENENSIEKEISPYRDELKDSMNVVLAKTKVDFVKNRPNGNLNNLIADIVYRAGMQRARIHSIAGNNSICLLNFGGLRAPINAGDITIGTCFEVMPFENEIVIATLNKDQVNAMVQNIKEAGGHPIGNCKLTVFDDSYDLMIGNTEYVPEFLYVITSDYLYNGGDNMSFFKGTRVIRTGYKIRDALIDYFYNNPEVENVEEERIKM